MDETSLSVTRPVLNRVYRETSHHFPNRILKFIFGISIPPRGLSHKFSSLGTFLPFPFFPEQRTVRGAGKAICGYSAKLLCPSAKLVNFGTDAASATDRSNVANCGTCQLTRRQCSPLFIQQFRSVHFHLFHSFIRLSI